MLDNVTSMAREKAAQAWLEEETDTFSSYYHGFWVPGIRWAVEQEAYTVAIKNCDAETRTGTSRDAWVALQTNFTTKFPTPHSRNAKPIATWIETIVNLHPNISLSSKLTEIRAASAKAKESLPDAYEHSKNASLTLLCQENSDEIRRLTDLVIAHYTNYINTTNFYGGLLNLARKFSWFTGVKKLENDRTIEKQIAAMAIIHPNDNDASPFSKTVNHMIASGVLVTAVLKAKNEGRLADFLEMINCKTLFTVDPDDPTHIVSTPQAALHQQDPKARLASKQQKRPIQQTEVIIIGEKNNKKHIRYRQELDYPWLIRRRQLLLGTIIVTGVFVLGLYFTGSLAISDFAMLLIIPATAIAIGMYMLTLLHPLVDEFSWTKTVTVKVATEKLSKPVVAPPCHPFRGGVEEMKLEMASAADEDQGQAKQAETATAPK